MYFYNYNSKVCFSLTPYANFNKIPEKTAMKESGVVYFLRELDPKTSRKSYSISQVSQLYLSNEDLQLLLKNNNIEESTPNWIISKIKSKQVVSINTNYPNWHATINSQVPSKNGSCTSASELADLLEHRFSVNICGLGDVGGTLLTTLRLIGSDCISKIGIYDTDSNKVARYEYEANQIYIEGKNFPPVSAVAAETIFDCDMFVFCVASGVPPIGSEKQDVRMVQLDANSKILSVYAKLARRKNFQGIFAVVSDPVDLLCKSALISSNTNEIGMYDLKGLLPEQIRGYGLGVMNARANFFARQNIESKHYKDEGRAFGPHGNGLIIADSIKNYNEQLSLELTHKTITANLQVRKTGYKPYIAPAISSAALPIIETLKGNWHYSSTFVGGVYMGVNNRLNKTGSEIEALNIPSNLMTRLNATYKMLGDMI
ncbi:MAG: lactate dehydrogenase [Alkaliphilus sp.]|nr:lactate dehydrogenase [bacterium AH-315-L21]PHS33838.1 MAG: lactate dehydrogenase [Alkaliphilus sp.]